MEADSNKIEEGPAVATVARTVLSAVFDELAKYDDLADVALKLRKLVLEDGVFAEPAIREALFSDDP